MELENNELKNNRINTFSNNLLNFTDNEKNSIQRKNNNIIINNKSDLKKYVLEAINNNKTKKNIYLGVLPNLIINKILNEITDISIENKANLFDINKEYQLVINQEEIRHLFKDSLTKNDVVNFIVSLDELIVNFDNVRFCIYNNNQKSLRFKKNMNDGTHIALEILSKQKGTMRTHTLFLDKIDFITNKKRNNSPTFDELNNSPNKTSEMDGVLVPSGSDSTINN